MCVPLKGKAAVLAVVSILSLMALPLGLLPLSGVPETDSAIEPAVPGVRPLLRMAIGVVLYRRLVLVSFASDSLDCSPKFVRTLNVYHVLGVRLGTWALSRGGSTFADSKTRPVG